MYRLNSLLLAFLWGFTSFGQEVPFTVSLNEISDEMDAPGLQSYIAATWQDKVLFIGGRNDGLHRRQPFASFLQEGNNTYAFVVNRSSGELVSSSLEGLEQALYEQLQSTNQQFVSYQNHLIATGGYGYSPTELDHTTFPGLIIIDVEGLVTAVESGTEGALLEEHFQRIEDEGFAVTGGYLGEKEGVFFLAGGQFFEGRYNPMGPDHGPGFDQVYTESIRRFTLTETDGTWTAEWLETWEGGEDLHRRDYNMVPQVFPDGSEGFTMFSGVFQIDQDIPWLNTVDVTESGYDVVDGFDQMLNQYHTAHLPVYDNESNVMHTLFFGGMSRYYFEDDQLWDDPNVPFVTTISRVSRYEDGTMTELKVGEMPGLLGSSAAFIPLESTPIGFGGILQLDELPNEPTVVGHIFGGIESSEPNIFFINNGSESEATTRVFEVIIHKGATGIHEIPVLASDYFHPVVYPNPSSGVFNLDFRSPSLEAIDVSIWESNGRFLEHLVSSVPNEEWSSYSIDISSYKPGTYILKLESRGKTAEKRIVIE